MLKDNGLHEHWIKSVLLCCTSLATSEQFNAKKKSTLHTVSSRKTPCERLHSEDLKHSAYFDCITGSICYCHIQPPAKTNCRYLYTLYLSLLLSDSFAKLSLVHGFMRCESKTTWWGCLPLFLYFPSFYGLIRTALGEISVRWHTGEREEKGKVGVSRV